MSFLFPFPENKGYKEQWADLNIPSFLSFFLTLMLLTHLSVTKFAFLPLTLQELHSTPIFLGLYAKYTLSLVFTLTTPFPS